MKHKTRERLVCIVLALLLFATIIAECIPLLIITVLLAVVLFFIAYYAPEYKEKKTPKARPIYTNWDRCYRMSQNLPY